MITCVVSVVVERGKLCEVYYTQLLSGFVANPLSNIQVEAVIEQVLSHHVQCKSLTRIESESNLLTVDLALISPKANKKTAPVRGLSRRSNIRFGNYHSIASASSSAKATMSSISCKPPAQNAGSLRSTFMMLKS